MKRRTNDREIKTRRKQRKKEQNLRKENRG